jgi:hypothetical protein
VTPREQSGVRRRFARGAAGVAALVLLLSGCDGGDGGTVNFNAFVKSQINAPSETKEPVDVNALTFTSRPGDDAESAFDSIVGPAPPTGGG